MRYLVVIERTPTGYSAYCPDLPGCVAACETLEATEREMGQAVAFHVEGLRREGLPVPEPSTRYSVVEVPA
jgi:predicted RNase H-like HicB family nuclease